MPIPIIATANGTPPTTVIAIAKAIQGIATRTRFAVSPRRPRRRRGCLGEGSGASATAVVQPVEEVHPRRAG